MNSHPTNCIIYSGCKVDSEGDFVCNQCPQYSSGKMCEDCIEGYARFGGSQQCIKKTGN